MAAKQIKKQQKRSISQVSRKATVKTTRKLPPKVAHEAVHKRIKRRVKLAVIPHRDNQYRPHLIRRYGLAAVLLLVLIGGVGFNFATRGSVLGEKSELTASGLLAYTNDQRN